MSYPAFMVTRQIEIDEDTERILPELAVGFDGDVGRAIAELVVTRERAEAFIGECELSLHESLGAQRQRAELGFREGRFTSWDEVKR